MSEESRKEAIENFSNDFKVFRKAFESNEKVVDDIDTFLKRCDEYHRRILDDYADTFYAGVRDDSAEFGRFLSSNNSKLLPFIEYKNLAKSLLVVRENFQGLHY